MRTAFDAKAAPPKPLTNDALQGYLGLGLPGDATIETAYDRNEAGRKIKRVWLRNDGFNSLILDIMPLDKRMHVVEMRAPVLRTGFGSALAANIFRMADHLQMHKTTVDAGLQDGAEFWLGFMRPVRKTTELSYLDSAGLRARILEAANELAAEHLLSRRPAARTLRAVAGIAEDGAMLDALHAARCYGEADDFLWQHCLDGLQVACAFDHASPIDARRRKAFLAHAKYRGPPTLHDCNGPDFS